MITNTFTAIDFETAHTKRWSICQIGLVRVENGEITKKLSILVRPPKNLYWNKFIEIHGITPSQTFYAPGFHRIWKLIAPFIENQHVVAHNGFSFDFPCLKQTLEYYGMSAPEFEGHCTYKIFKKKLVSLSEEYQIPLKHHDALSDALACAKLFQIHLKKHEKMETKELQLMLN